MSTHYDDDGTGAMTRNFGSEIKFTDSLYAPWTLGDEIRRLSKLVDRIEAKVDALLTVIDAEQCPPTLDVIRGGRHG